MSDDSAKMRELEEGTALKTARRGTIWGGFLKVWPVLIFLVPGLIGAALHEKELIDIPLNKAGGPDGDQVFPTMFTQLLPAGLRGLVVAGILAALMSSLSSLFNSSASLFTVDIYEKIRPGASEKRLVFGDGKTFESPAFLAWIGDFNFLYASGILFLISVCIVLAVSYTSEPPDPEKIKGLTYSSLDKKAVRESWNRWDVICTGGVLGLVLAIYLYFSFWI
ncbi:MAG: sodium:solute symporter family transporter [Planctomycetota bacterium]|jgi:uncharacterized sodium:solute symporter family permease YidK